MSNRENKPAINLFDQFQLADERFLMDLAKQLAGNAALDWRRYQNPDIVDWIQTHFYIPETKGPMPLHESQAIPLREALGRDAQGNFKYSTVVWGSIKKSAKSTIAAAVAIWMMWQDEFRSGKIIANDLKQSQSRVFYYAKRAIMLHPEWRNICRITQTKIEFPNHSILEAIPMDPEGEAGGNDDFVSYTEIWAWRTDKAQRMWTESTLSPTKYGQSIRWLDTYAGFSGESNVLERLYDSAVKEENAINLELQMYALPYSRLFVLWNTVPRLPFQTQAYYAQEANALTPAEFSRVHKNEWVSAEDSFCPPEWWDQCKTQGLRGLTKMEPVILAMDAAVTGDTFGLLAVAGNDKDEDEAKQYFVRYARRWVPPKHGRIDFEEIEQEVRRLCAEYNIIEVCIDEYQLAQMAEHLEDDLIANVYRFPQGKQRSVADKRLQDAIRDRRIRHDGDAHLREHVINANYKIVEDNKLRIVKRAEHLKIDLCVCLSMALDRVISWNL